MIRTCSLTHKLNYINSVVITEQLFSTAQSRLILKTTFLVHPNTNENVLYVYNYYILLRMYSSDLFYNPLPH